MTSNDLSIRPRLVIITAPSGAGKTTLCQKLLKDFSPKLVLSISSTTRNPRGTERDGIEYHFLSPSEFKKQIEMNGFAEWASVHGHYYGTAKQTIAKASQEGKALLLDIDVQGADSLKTHYPNDCLLIFISPPDLEELEIRLRRRATESEESIQNRLTNAKKEMNQRDKFDHVIVNDSLLDAYDQLSKIVQGFLAKGHQ